MAKAVRENSIRTQLGLFASPTEKITILVCACGRYKTGWKET